MEAIEEGTRILGGGPLELPRLDGAGECREIAGDEVGIEPEIPNAQDHIVRTHFLTQGVEGLVETLPGTLLVAFGPQHGQELVPRPYPAHLTQRAARASRVGAAARQRR